MHVLPYVVVGADGRTVILVVACVLFRELSKADVLGKIHAELTARKAAIHDVVGIRIRLDNGGKHILALIQMLRDPPLLEAEDEHARYRLTLLLVLDNVHTATLLFRNRSSHERTGNTPHVHVLDRPEKPQ